MIVCPQVEIKSILHLYQIIFLGKKAERNGFREISEIYKDDALVAYLASELANQIAGQVFVVDGGMD